MCGAAIEVGAGSSATSSPGHADPALIEAIVGSVVAGWRRSRTVRRAMSPIRPLPPRPARGGAGARRRIQRSLIPLVTPASPATRSPAATRLRARWAATSSTCSGSGTDWSAGYLDRGRDRQGHRRGPADGLRPSVVHAAVDHARAPRDALERTNRILVEERRSSLFITALCAVVDLRRGILRLANAGHEPPLLVPADGGPTTWLEGSGRLLGAFARLDLIRTVDRPGARRPDCLLYRWRHRYAGGDRRAVRRRPPAGGRRGLAGPGTGGPGRGDLRGDHRFQGEMPMADDLTIVALRRAPRQRSLSGGATRFSSAVVVRTRGSVAAAPACRPTSSSGPGQPRSARYSSRYLTTKAWMTAASGMATIAPIAPASWAPSRNAKVTTIGWSWSAPARTSGARMFSSMNQPTSITIATMIADLGSHEDGDDDRRQPRHVRPVDRDRHDQPGQEGGRRAERQPEDRLTRNAQTPYRPPRMSWLRMKPAAADADAAPEQHRVLALLRWRQVETDAA